MGARANLGKPEALFRRVRAHHAAALAFRTPGIDVMIPEPGNDAVRADLAESALAPLSDERKDPVETVPLSHSCLNTEVMNRVEWAEWIHGLRLEPIPQGEIFDSIFEPGELVAGRFRIVRELGRGGMGVVYEADDEKLERKVAIKCARSMYQKQLTPEARTALEVSHPNVCKLHELHAANTVSGPIDFLTMEFIPGETLSARLERDGPLAPGDARTVALQICSGLAQVHSQGVIHGDLKTGNIILADPRADSTGKPIRAVLTDFGLARFVRAAGGAQAGRAQAASARGGTFKYMAPELFEGARASIKSDIFALGVLFHCMLAGNPVDAGAKPNLPAPWDRIVGRCLEIKPESRFESVGEIVGILDRRRSVAKWPLAATLVVVVGLGVSIWRTPDNSGPPVRLAILPVKVEGAAVPASAGLGADIADRLSGVRKHFSVIAPGEASRDRVNTVEKARTALGATHVLRIALTGEGGRVTASAAVIDAKSGQVLRELHGEYASGDQALLARALLGTVTGVFNLRAGVPRESVSGPGYSSYIQGMALMRRDGQSADEAMPFFRKAIELDPGSALPWAGLAQAQLQKFDNRAGDQWLVDAEASVAKARSMNPDAVPVLLASGSVQQEHGRYEQAITDYSRAAELDPGNSEALRLLAGAYEKTNRGAEAAATFRRAIDAEPDNYWAYLYFGNYYFFRNQFDEAEKLYRQVTVLAPSFARGHMDLGNALTELGRFDEAEKSMLIALRLSRTAQILLNTGTLYYLEERYSEAARLFNESLAAGVPTVVRYADLGDALRHLGQQSAAGNAYRQGAALAEKELVRDPRPAYTRILLAHCMAQLGDTRHAQFELSQALAAEPENATVMRDAVIASEFLGNRDQSISILRRAPANVIRELNRNPDVKRLREDARFRDMISDAQKQ
jgi:tetratricopeptide (TPR) repeat protein